MGSEKPKKTHTVFFSLVLVNGMNMPPERFFEYVHERYVTLVH